MICSTLVLLATESGDEKRQGIRSRNPDDVKLPMTNQAIIVGAGFSSYAGLPLQSQFTAELLRASSFRKGPSKRLVNFLSDFVRDTFHPRRELDPDRWPELEDLFTCVDLSANSGHHLGADHPPAVLRTVRRALIARIIRMLEKRTMTPRTIRTKSGAHSTSSSPASIPRPTHLSV